MKYSIKLTQRRKDAKNVWWFTNRCFPLALLFFIFCFFSPFRAEAYLVRYKEQYYRLFHMHHQANPDNILENLYWLERALEVPFANPLFALAHIENEVEWEKYRYLFMMHVNIKMAEQHLFLGNHWNKRQAFFYNAPWKEQNLEALETAENAFRTALFYWEEALTWVEKLQDRRLRWINLRRVQFWEDEAYRIMNGGLNYARTIDRELVLLQAVRERFEAMDDTSY